VQQLNTLTREAHETYQQNIEIATRNRTTQVAKNAGFTALRLFLSLFVLELRANEAIGENELVVLGLPSRKHHTRLPLPAPTEEPEVNVVTGRNRELRVYVRIPRHGHPTRSRTRKAYHGFVVRYRKEGDAEWHSEYSTRLYTDLFFNDDDRGKRLVLSAAWINPCLRHGPWSQEVQVLIN
jgi:hypothetical protein